MNFGIKDTQKRDITKKTGYSNTSTDAYLKSGFNPVHGQYGKSRDGKLMPFRSGLVNLRVKGLTYREIYENIKEKNMLGR